MSLIYLFQLLELMRLVLVAKETTIGADGHLACLAEVTQSRVVLWAKLLLPTLCLRLLSLHHAHDICEEAAGDELVGS